MNISDFKTVVITPQSTLIYERHTNRKGNIYTSVSTNVNVTMGPNNCILESVFCMIIGVHINRNSALPSFRKLGNVELRFICTALLPKEIYLPKKFHDASGNYIVLELCP